MRRAFGFGLAFALVACAPAHDAGQDGGSRSTDGGTENRPPVEPSCAAAPTAGDAFAIDPAGASEISPHAAFDGTIWLAYSRVAGNGSENFDVGLAHLGCDGSALQPARDLSASPDTNDVDATVAAGADRVLVAWSSDDSANFPNLSLRYAELGKDGSTLVDVTTLATTLPAPEAEAEVWQPSAVALGGGRFLVAGARGLVGQPGGFRAFLQHLGADGKSSGDTVDAPADEGGTADDPVVATTPDGAELVAWSREDDATSTASMKQSLVQQDGSLGDPVDTLGIRDGEYPSAVSAPWSPFSLLAFQSVVGSSAGIVVKDAFTGPDAAKLELTVPSAGSYGPQVALSPTGGAVAWFAQNAAGQREIVAQAFGYDGHSFSAGTTTVVSGTDPVGPSAPAIVHLAGDLFFVAWSQGTSPDFELYGRVVALD